MKFKIGLILVGVLVATLVAYIYYQSASVSTAFSAEGKQELTLTRPTFLSSVGTIAAALGEEAGMSIWLNATTWAPLSVVAAQNGLKNVEINTSDYVIGSIDLTSLGFSSDDWPHCFVHKTGWIIVYYLKINSQNPDTTGWVGKIFPMFKDSDWNWYDKDSNSLNDNLLHKALAMICSQIPGIPGITDARYYHFQYPNATTLEIAIKTARSGQTLTFNINVPSIITVDERSWSYYGRYGVFKIDTTTIFSGYIGSESYRRYGGPEITAPLLSPDVWHTVTVQAQGGYGDTTACIVILYH